VALNEYEELYFKVKRGGSLKGIPFSKVFNEWKTTFLSVETTHKLLSVKSKSLTASTDKLKPNSIRHYRSSINHIFSYAKTMGYIDSIPDIPAPPTKANPRPHFSKQDWKILTEYMRKWVIDNTKGSPGVNGLDHKRHRERFYLQHFILIRGNTGIRIGGM
jgi:hypothetical protein